MSGKLGAKLRRARENLGITQEELSKAVGLSSEFISLLEIGKRAPSLDSLRRLSGFLNKDIGYFLQEPEDNFQSLRQEKKLGKEALNVIRRFQRYCEDYLRIEDLTQRRAEPAPFFQNASAERLALEERRRLGLGDEPIRDIFSLLELNGLRILRQVIPETAKIAGIFVFFDAEQAGFALIDASRPLGEQHIAAAHEYAHYLKDRFAGPILDNPDVFIDEYLPLYHPREKFAQQFAYDFLVPPRKLKHVVSKELHARSLHFEDVIFLKRYFGIKTVHMLSILQKQEILPPHRVNEFREVDHAEFERSLFGKVGAEELPGKARTKLISSDRYKTLGVSAFQKTAREKS
ncbi:MAG: helix-turn-helix domain-containing protein [Candidatus Aminicenantaceae bacterium]